MYVYIMCPLYVKYFSLKKHRLKICDIQGQNVKAPSLAWTLSPMQGTHSNDKCPTKANVAFY